MNQEPKKVGKTLWFEPIKRKIGYSLRNTFSRSYSETEKQIADYVNNSPHKWILFVAAFLVVIILNILFLL